MKTASETELKIVELCGRIAVLAELNKWGDIQDLLKQLHVAASLDAYEKGIRDAAAICERKAGEFSPVGIARTALHEAKHEALSLLTKPKDKE